MKDLALVLLIGSFLGQMMLNTIIQAELKQLKQEVQALKAKP